MIDLQRSLAQRGGATTNGPLSLLLDALAVRRLTMLVTTDTLTRPLRERWIEASYRRAQPNRFRSGDGGDFAPVASGDMTWAEFTLDDDSAPRLATLAACARCASVWCAFAVVTLRRLAPRAWAPVATALALSSASTLLAGLED